MWSLGLGGGFVQGAKSCRCLRSFFITSEKVQKERKQKICSLVTQVDPVKFSSGSNTLMQRNLAKCSDNQKILKSKISRRMVSKTPFEFPVQSTVKGSIELPDGEKMKGVNEEGYKYFGI